MYQGFEFNPRSEHIQESTNESINKWNNQPMLPSLPPPPSLSPSLSLCLKMKNFLKSESLKIPRGDEAMGQWLGHSNCWWEGDLVTANAQHAVTWWEWMSSDLRARNPAPQCTPYRHSSTWCSPPNTHTRAQKSTAHDSTVRLTTQMFRTVMGIRTIKV